LSNMKLAGKLCKRIAVVFLALWFIAQVTNLLGEYEYPEYFLGFTFLFYLLGSPLENTRYNVKKVAYGVAKATFLIWLFIVIGYHFKWTGFEFWKTYSDYFIIAFFASILVGYSAGKHRRGARTVFYGIGFLGIAFWIFAKIFDIFPDYQPLIFFGSIAAVGIGYIVGVFEEERKLKWTYDVEDIEKVEEPRIKEKAYVLNSDLEVKKGKGKINIEEGSIFVPIENGKEMGGVFFGQGSYSVDAGIKKYVSVFQGITVLTGNKWKDIKKNMNLRDAEDKDLENIGLKKEEVFDLARIQIEEGEWRKIRKRFEKTVTSIDMPFVKVKETERGDYVKVGPIEVIDVEGKEPKVKIGPLNLMSGIEWEDQALYDISARMRTKNREIHLKMKGDKIILKEGKRTVISKPDKVIIEDEDLNLKITENRRVLKSKDLNIIESEEKTILKTPDIKIVFNDELSIKKNGESYVIKNPRIKQEIKEKLDDLIRDVLDKKEMKELEALLEKLKKES